MCYLLRSQDKQKEKFVKIKLLIHIFQRFVIKINSIFVLCILAASTASASDSSTGAVRVSPGRWPSSTVLGVFSDSLKRTLGKKMGRKLNKDQSGQPGRTVSMILTANHSYSANRSQQGRGKRVRTGDNRMHNRRGRGLHEIPNRFRRNYSQAVRLGRSCRTFENSSSLSMEMDHH